MSARISSLVDDPYPAIDHWESDDEQPTSHAGPHIPQAPLPSSSEPEETHIASPGIDQYYQFSPSFATPAAAGMPPMGPHDNHPYSSGYTGIDGPLYDSPEMMSKEFQPFSGPPTRSGTISHQEGFSPVSLMSGLPRSPPATADQTPDGLSRKDSIQSPERRTNTSPSPYEIPSAPPLPTIPFDEPYYGPGKFSNFTTPPAPLGPPVDTSYDSARFSTMDEEARTGPRNNRRSQHGGPSREGSIRRLGTRLFGTVRRERGSGGAMWGGTVKDRNRDTLLEESEDLERSAGNYMELEEDHEPIQCDISTFGAEFSIPLAAAKAMESHGFDEDMAYTGTGEAIDLSNLAGLDHQPSDSSDGLSMGIGRAGTIENTHKRSYFFAPDREIPNWKPVALRNWFIISLLVITAGMVACVEVLYQMSDRGKFRQDGKVGLFGYYDITTDLTVIEFGIWKYVPTLVGVIYGILWKVTDEGIKRGEPYYQLSRGAKGVLAAESLNIEYHTLWSPFVPIAALKHKQFVVVACGILSFMASAGVPVLLSVFIRVHPSQKGRKKIMADKHLKDIEIEKNIIVDRIFSYLLEVTLVVIMALGIYVLYKLANRRSGLLGDPSGVAGVAAMANKSHILMDFKDLDLASEEKIHKQLNKRTYVLHKGALWQSQLLKESERNQSAPKAMNPHPLLLRAKGMGPFLGFSLIVLIMLPLMVKVPELNVIIDRTPWIITGLSIVIKSLWELVEKDMRMLEPFWILYQGDAHSSVLTLDYTATIPVFIVLKALSKGHFLLAWVTFVTVLIEVLTVVMGSLDANGGEESTLSSKLSFGLALTILAILIFTGLLVLKLRRHPFLPRQPGTISSVLAFIYQSNMLVDFEGTEQKSTLQRKRQLAKFGKRYGFGWYIGRDGRRHLGIDFEPLIAKYKFRQDSNAAVVVGPVPDRYD